jgi:putative nucleotidyltransferase with HDIG domain
VSRKTLQNLVPKWRNLKESASIRMTLYSIIALMMYLAMLSNVMTEKLDVGLFSIAKKDILSPITIIDKRATEEKQAQAAAEVSSQYTYKQKEALIQIEKTAALYDSIINIKSKMNQQSGDDEGEPVGQESQTSEEQIDLLKERLSDDLIRNVSKQSLKTLFAAPSSELSVAKEMTGTAVNDVMASHITWSDLQEAKNSVNEKIPETSLPAELHDAVINVSQAAIVPNKVFSAELTKQEREEAVEVIEDVVIQDGQILAKEGQVINREILHQLEVVGLLDEKFNPLPFLGLVALVLLLVGLLYHELNRISSGVRSQNTYILMYAVILFATILSMKVVSLVQEQGIHGIAFIVPAAMGTMLIRLLINEKLAVMTSIVLAVCGSFIFNVETTGAIHFTYGIYILFSCLSGAVFLRKKNPKISRAGLLVSVINMAIVAIFLMIKSGQYTWFDISLEFTFALLSGFLAAVFTLGLIPVLEAAFGILSTMRLIELSNPNHPLLRKILTEAPGTYHHSVMVANLAEAGCESVGANGLLARVSSYYHDIGKTKQPHLFIENQMNMENPHDKISPRLSRTVILSHPYDGADMLREHHLPQEIVDIAEQHHGTSLLKFFFHKAKKNDDNISENEFRYPGPKPQTKEAAIIQISDSVEAAVRSLAKATPTKIETLVKNIINDKLEDGQFDECDLTFKELNGVATMICETLNGIFHSRIEYPEEDVKKKVSDA